jgi:hypothetical protein
MSDLLVSHIGLIDARTVGGFVHDPARPERQFVVEILGDDVPIAAVRADSFSPALAAQGISDPYHGFVLTLGARHAATTRRISVRLANLETPLGETIDLDARPRPDQTLAAAGRIESAEGPLISGWVAAGTGSTVAVRASSAGEEVAVTVARDWVNREIGGEMRPVLAFKLRLPGVLGDGSEHRIVVATAAGAPLSGSPVVVSWDAATGN